MHGANRNENIVKSRESESPEIEEAPYGGASCFVLARFGCGCLADTVAPDYRPALPLDDIVGPGTGVPTGPSVGVRVTVAEPEVVGVPVAPPRGVACGVPVPITTVPVGAGTGGVGVVGAVPAHRPK